MAGILFDVNTVPGLSNPRVIEVPFWLGNTDVPDLFSWDIPPSLSGITIFPHSFVSAGVGAQTSWCQLSTATTNVAGTPVGYAAAGASITTPAIKGSDTFVTGTTAGATSITINNSSNFIAGDYIKIGSGTVNVEVVQITAIPDATHLTVSTTNSNHAIGETIFSCGRKFWLKVTVPLNAVGGVATSLYNIGIGKTYVITSRL